MNWYDANIHCKSKGGKLVEVDSREENTALVDEMNRRHYKDKKMSFWIGLTDRESEGDWRLASNGLKPVYENWHRGQPNNFGGNEDCAMIWVTSFTDENCTSSTNTHTSMHALCEFGLPKERLSTEGTFKGNHNALKIALLLLLLI